MFWIISAILILIALIFLLPVLRKNEPQLDASREQNIFIAKEQLNDLETRFERGEINEDDYQNTREELELSLFSDLSDSSDNRPKLPQSKRSIFSAALILLLIPAITLPVYFKMGNLNYINSIDSKQALTESRDKNIPKNADGTPDIETMVAGLQQKMDNNPDNAKGWFMLGRSYMVLERYPEAAKSFERAYKLLPDSPNVMLSLADSLSMSQRGSLIGRPKELVAKALKMEPQNITALWLSGMAARQEADYQGAIAQWNKVLPLIQDAPEQTAQLKSLISEARSKLPSDMQTNKTSPPRTEATQVSADENKSKPDAEIKVMVSLSDELKNKASPTDLVFIYAKAMSGPPMPLAAVRKQVKDLPMQVVLNDAMAMMPNLKLSSFESVVVGARVSKSGQPIASNGDLYAEKQSIKRGDDISIEINEILVK